MNKEIKLKLEQEVKAYTIPYIRNYGQRIGDIVRQDFISIYQTILENPIEWGLCSLEVLEATSVSVGKAWADNERLKSQLAKYRGALEHLERFTSDNPDYEFINHRLKEALKQEDTK